MTAEEKIEALRATDAKKAEALGALWAFYLSRTATESETERQCRAIMESKVFSTAMKAEAKQTLEREQGKRQNVKAEDVDKYLAVMGWTRDGLFLAGISKQVNAALYSTVQAPAKKADKPKTELIKKAM